MPVFMTDFIPFDLAYQLKELGFDEECLGFYDAYNGDSHLFLHDRYKPLWLVRTWRRLFFKSSEETTFANQSYVEYINGVCLAPTFSQAFRWFREKHGLRNRNYASLNYSGGISEYFEIFQYAKETSDKILSINVGSLIYEKAELACLGKLIEIVKQKKRKGLIYGHGTDPYRGRPGSQGQDRQ